MTDNDGWTALHVAVYNMNDNIPTSQIIDVTGDSDMDDEESVPVNNTIQQGIDLTVDMNIPTYQAVDMNIPTDQIIDLTGDSDTD